MQQPPRRILAGGLVALGLSFGLHSAAAQSATAVPGLDVNRYMGAWYQIARYPLGPEKHCLSDAAVLYALGDKKNTFQVVTSCTIKDGNSDSWNASGKLSKTNDGRLKLRRLLIFSRKYWVLAVAPDYSWALVGSPNHKSLWVLSRSTTLPPEVLNAIQAKAVAAGFNDFKLKAMPQHEQIPKPTQ